jgi:hypothetical protein
LKKGIYFLRAFIDADLGYTRAMSIEDCKFLPASRPKNIKKENLPDYLRLGQVEKK